MWGIERSAAAMHSDAPAWVDTVTVTLLLPGVAVITTLPHEDVPLEVSRHRSLGTVVRLEPGIG